MKITNINVKSLEQGEIIKEKINGFICKRGDKLYKIVGLKLNVSELKQLEKRLDTIEQLQLDEMPEACLPNEKLYDHKLVGYATTYLDGYVDLITAAISLNNDEKIDLLIRLSKAVKKLHEHGVAHTDLYSDNVLSDGTHVKIIDFDDSNVYKRGERVSYYNSPYADIVGINNLMLELLTVSGIESRKSSGVRLPKEIKKYIQHFEHGILFGQDSVKVSDISTYPHDWLNELRDYVGPTDSFQRELY